jgi:hypothetical protein
MSEIILMLIKCLVVVTVTFLITSYLKKATRIEEKGVLKYKLPFYLVVIFNVAFAGLLWFILLSKNYQYHQLSQTFSLIALVIFFTLSSVYLTFEVIFVKGYFDDDGIWFESFWEGRRFQRWENMVFFDKNDLFSWYILEFEDGTKIRLSYFLGGVNNLLEFLIEPY